MLPLSKDLELVKNLGLGVALLSTGAIGYWLWVCYQTQGIYTGFSLQRIRFAHMTEIQRLEQACNSAHALSDLAAGHSAWFCRKVVKD